jgi:hypothetical protein|uniref:Uncharacterized protein n=1 Tax=viral metagenome TaxID=1070528 RepID=A0A6C0J0Q5_9ZZZZ
MDEKLIEPKNTNQPIISNLIIFITFLYCSTFLIYMIMMYQDIHKIYKNVESVTNIFNQYNDDDFNQIRQDLSEINDCVLHKYCKRVPDS